MDLSIRLRRSEDDVPADVDTTPQHQKAKREPMTIVMRAGQLVAMPKSRARPSPFNAEASDGDH